MLNKREAVVVFAATVILLLLILSSIILNFKIYDAMYLIAILIYIIRYKLSKDV